MVTVLLCWSGRLCLSGPVLEMVTVLETGLLCLSGPVLETGLLCLSGPVLEMVTGHLKMKDLKKLLKKLI